MIQRIVMDNFEAHVHTELVLDKGVYILAGNSNAGKSSIFRALRWVLKNQPGGEDYINFDSQECSVEIEYNEHIVRRVKARANKKNEYWVDGKLLKAFGQSVPDEVQKIFGLTDINFEWQFDHRPFLISETGGYIASKLNEIVNLELIDSSLKNIESMRRQTNNEISDIKEQIKGLQEKIDSLSWLEQAELDLATVECLQSSYNEAKAKVDTLHDLIESLQYNENKKEQIRVISDLQILGAQEKIEQYKFVSTTYNLMLQTIENLRTLNARNKDIKLVDELDVIDLTGKIKALNEQQNVIESLHQTLFLLRQNQKKLEDLGELVSERRLAKLEQTIAEYLPEKNRLQQLLDLIEEYKVLLLKKDLIAKDISDLHEEYKEIAPDVCPLCGAEFNKDLEDTDAIHIHN